MRRLLFLMFGVVLASLVWRAPAAASPAPSPRATAPAHEPGEELTISVLSIGQGDAVFEKFGHNAIWVHDAFAPAPYQDVIFHWGLFDFTEEGFFLKYLLGQMDYSMGAFPLDEQIAFYRDYANRSIWVQELNLTPAQRLKLRDFLYWNQQPENAVYRYNYYTDNCSTRVRDAIDMAVGGAVQRQLESEPTGTTFRWHTRRLTRDNIFWYSVLNLVLGPAIDRPIDAWQECFLPLKLRDHLREVTVEQAGGVTVPLVKSERVLFQSDRPAEAQAPPNWVVGYFLAGGLVAAGMVACWRWAKRGRGRGRWAFLSVATTYTLILGLCGAIGLWGWFFTTHWAVWRNENLLGYSPLALPLAFLLPLIFGQRPRVKAAAAMLAIAVAATTAVGFLLTPLLPQHNAEPMAFVLPINLALAWCVWCAVRPCAAAPARAAARRELSGAMS